MRLAGGARERDLIPADDAARRPPDDDEGTGRTAFSVM
jgi:hypothetical protein